jgi:hypothetical protein
LILSAQIIFLKILKSYVPNQQPDNVRPHQPYWVTPHIIYTPQAKQPYNNHYQKPRNKPSLHEVFDNGVVPRLSNNGKYNSHNIALPIACEVPSLYNMNTLATKKAGYAEGGLLHSPIQTLI